MKTQFVTAVIRSSVITLAMSAALAIPQLSQANCGASFCMVNTNWNLQGFAPETGLRADLRYEFINQNRPRSGSSNVSVGQIPHHHDEVKTINRNWLAGLDYTFNREWGVSATIPVVDRGHMHIHNHHGGQLVESWNFTKLGDIRILGRRQWMAEQTGSSTLSYYGINAGVKLATGSRTVANADGDRAERSLQPGTGTTDLLIGGYYSRVLPLSDSSWFVQGLWQGAIHSREDYRPGNRLSLDAGYRYELSNAVGAMIQINALKRWRDSGQQAEPDDTGGMFLFVSPGLSYALAKDLQVYGFLQKPVYQQVNGLQLTSSWSGVLGVSAKF